MYYSRYSRAYQDLDVVLTDLARDVREDHLVRVRVRGKRLRVRGHLRRAWAALDRIARREWV